MKTLTCIIGLMANGKVYMGADSAAVGDNESRILTPSKIFLRGKFLIGFTSSFRMGQILQYMLDVRDQNPEEPDYNFMVTGFAWAVRKVFKDEGYSTVENNAEVGGCFLVGYRGQLYQVQSDFSVLRYADDFDAIGCGACYALAAMAALDTTPPVVRITKSLAVTAEFCPGVRSPFIVRDT